MFQTTLEIVNFLAAFAAIVFAIYSHRKNLKVTQLSFAVESTGLFRSVRNGKIRLNVSYETGEGEVPFEFVRIDTLKIWNSGTEVIYDHDIVQGRPLRIEIENNCFVIEGVMVGCSNPSNCAIFDRSGNTLSFKYLDPGDGFAVTVAHTSEAPLKFDGVIIGAKIRNGVEIAASRERTMIPLVVVAVIGVVAILSFVLIGLKSYLSGDSFWNPHIANLRSLFLTLSVALIAATLAAPSVLNFVRKIMMKTPKLAPVAHVPAVVAPKQHGRPEPVPQIDL